MGDINGKIGRDGIIGRDINIGKILFDRESKGTRSKQERTNFKAFISYASEHESLAKFLRDFTENFFRDLSPIFVSNDPCCIPAGKDWLQLIPEFCI